MTNQRLINIQRQVCTLKRNEYTRSKGSARVKHRRQITLTTISTALNATRLNQFSHILRTNQTMHSELAVHRLRNLAYLSTPHTLSSAHLVPLLLEPKTTYYTTSTVPQVPGKLNDEETILTEGESVKRVAQLNQVESKTTHVPLNTVVQTSAKSSSQLKDSHLAYCPFGRSSMHVTVSEPRNLKCQSICWFLQQTCADVSSASPENEEYDMQNSPDRIEAELTLEQPVLLEEGAGDLDIIPSSTLKASDATDIKREIQNLPQKTDNTLSIPTSKTDYHQQEENVPNAVKLQISVNAVSKRPSDGSFNQLLNGNSILQSTDKSTENSSSEPDKQHDKYNLNQSLAASQKSGKCSQGQRVTHFSLNGDNLDQTESNENQDVLDQREIMRSKEIAHRILEELVTTERSYCRSLYAFSEVVAKNVCTKSGVSLKELRMLFPRCLPDLYAMHVDMLTKMEAEIKLSGKSLERPTKMFCIKPPFIVLLEALELKRIKRLSQNCNSRENTPTLDFGNRDSHFFTLYKRYFSEFTVAMETMQKLTRQSSRFRQTLKRLQQHPECEGFDFSAFLLAPIQRLPRYLLLVRQLTRHLKKLSNAATFIGDIEVAVVLELAQITEKHLHTILVHLDSQLAEQRQQPKVNHNQPPVRPTEPCCVVTNAGLYSTNANENSIIPCTNQLREINGDISQGLWPRMRRAFSEKRASLLNDDVQQDCNRGTDPMTQSCKTTSRHMESLDHNNTLQAAEIEPISTGQSPEDNYCSEEGLAPLDEQPIVAAQANKTELFVTVENPSDGLFTCRNSGNVDATMHRSIRRKTVGEVISLMQDAFLIRPKHYSLDRSQCASHPDNSPSLCRSRESSLELSRQEYSPQPVTPSFTDRWPCLNTDPNNLVASEEKSCEGNKRIKVKRVNTFPSKQISSLMRLQRRKSEPCSASPPHSQRCSRITSIPEDLIETTLEGDDSLYSNQDQYTENETTLLTQTPQTSELVNPNIAQVTQRNRISACKSFSTVRSHSMSSTTGSSSNVFRTTSQQYRVSDEIVGTEKVCRRSMPLTYSSESDKIKEVNLEKLTTVNVSTRETYKNPAKKTLTSWKKALQNFFRRKGSDKDNPRLRNRKSMGTMTHLLPPIPPSESTGGRVSQYTPSQAINILSTVSDATKLTDSKEQNSYGDSKDLNESDEKSSFETLSVGRSGRLFTISDQIPFKPIGNSCQDMGMQLDCAVVEDVFLDETGNPCIEL